MMILSTPVPDTTPSLYIPETTLMGFQGVGVYVFEPEKNTTTLLQTYVPQTAPFLYFQVGNGESDGFWWVPTAPINLTPFSWNTTAWGGITDLKRNGTGIWEMEGRNRMVRPARMVWWIPRLVLAQSDFPATQSRQKGGIIGVFPNYSPGGKPQKPSVETTDSGFLITLPPSSGTTEVEVAT